MKKAIVLASLLAALAISAQAEFAIQVSDLAVAGADDPDGSNVTVTATITVRDIAWGAQAMLSIRATNELVGQLFQPESLELAPVSPVLKDPDMGVCYWTNTSWNPYFTGDFIVSVTANPTNAVALKGGMPSDTASVTVTVARTFGGTVNSVKVQDEVVLKAGYDPEGNWNDIDLERVYLHSIGVMEDPSGAVSVGCNLINVTNITGFMTEEQMDIAFTDTGDYRPVDTPFRFDVNLHARPTSMMGFGDVQRFVWTPVSEEAPAGPGRLVVDVLACSPWRNNYSTNLRAHVGFAPLFAADTEMEEDIEGLIMCTTAHYMDVGPEADEVGIGLKVNGHSNTTSYLKMFISDEALARWGIPVDQATNVLTGYTTHFNAQGQSEGDTTAVVTEFIRVDADDSMYEYYSRAGDSGYEAQLTFTFHSPVAAQIGLIRNVFGDYDGDGKTDLAVFRNGYWSIFSLVNGIILANAGDWGDASCTPVPGDYDGDGKADLALFRDGYWSIYSLANGIILLNAGEWGDASCTPVPGDYDGDGVADLAFYRDGYWSIYSLVNGIILLNAGEWGGADCIPVPGDYDGDGKADLAFYRDGYWSIFSLANGLILNNVGIWGGADCVPVPGDYDGDGEADLAFYRNGYWSIFSLANGLILNEAGEWGGAGKTPVQGDYDGDGKADLSFYHDGYWSIFSLANGLILNEAGEWGGAGWNPVQ